jgi:hypothetical protein
VKRFAQWFISRAILAACLWFGLVDGVQGARNVGIVMVWVFIVTVLVIASSRLVEQAAKNPEIAPAVPMWFNVSFDFTIAGFLVWHGFIATGVTYLLHVGVYLSAVDRIKKRRAELAEPPWPPNAYSETETPETAKARAACAEEPGTIWTGPVVER